MCGKAPPAPPPIVQRDPVAEQAKAEADAQVKANAETAGRRRRRVAGGGGASAMAVRSATLGAGTAQAPSLLAQARPEG